MYPQTANLSLNVLSTSTAEQTGLVVDQIPTNLS
jgi:hypothetical protein